MRRLFRLIIIAALAASTACVSACIPSASASKARSREVIRLSGRGCCVSSLEALTAAYPGADGVEFEYVSCIECADGAEQIASGRIDVAAVEDDIHPADYSSGLRYLPLVRDHLAIAVNQAAGVKRLSPEQLRGVFTGRYTNWSQVGGADLPIIVLDSAEAESTKRAFRRSVLGDDPVTPRAVTLFYEEDVAAAVQKTAGSVGCISLGYAKAARIQANLLRIADADVERDFAETDYSSTRIVGIVYSAGARPAVRDFIEWASGDQAAGVLEQEGFEAASPAR